MIPTLETRIISNFILCIDHVIQQAGKAYTNYSSQFFPMGSDLAGYYAYGAPFKPMCNDVSVSGANVLSGLYLNGLFNPIGSGHFKAFNHYKGMAYFDQPLAGSIQISGNYAIKDFSIALSDQPEWKLLFDTKYVSNNEYNQILSGLDPETKICPIIYVLVKGQQNEPFGITHIDNAQLNIRCVVISDTEYQSLGACSILKNMYQQFLPMLKNQPFDTMGNITGSNYNYKTQVLDSQYPVWISKAKSIDISQKGDYKDIRKNLALVDFSFSTIVQNAQGLP